jgi:uncharacterized protein (TIGR02597 family)
MTYSFPATTTTVSTFISVPLTNPAVFAGPVVSFTANTITVAGTPFTASQLVQPGSPFFLRIVSGAQAGRMILVTANGTNTITADVTDNSSQTTNFDTSGFSLAVGDKVQVVVGDTLGSLLGDNTSGNPLLFVGSTSVFTADSVSIYNKIFLKFDAYFFSTTSGYWRLSSSSANANNLILYPDSSILITRRTGRSATSLTIVGDIPATPPLMKTTGSAQPIYVATQYPADITLSQLALPNWTKSNSLFTADTLSIYNPTLAKFDSYFQRLDNSEWRKSGDTVTNQSSLILPAGSAIVLLKRGVVSGAVSYLSTPLPYSL